MSFEILSVRFVPGYFGKLRQPSYAFVLRRTTAPLCDEALLHFWSRLASVCSLDASLFSESLSVSSFYETITNFCTQALHSLAAPVFTSPYLLSESQEEMVIYIPTLSMECKVPVVLISWLEHILRLEERGEGWSAARLSTEYAVLLGQLKRMLPTGTNIPLLIDQANLLGIPWRHRVSTIYQFGIGRYARLMDSTITDRTSGLAVRLARDKFASNKFLGEMGLPVTQTYLVGSLKQAKMAAKQLGFPLVIKPSNLDGGLGVQVGIFDEQSIEKAFNYARKLSPSILIEKYVDGLDCRLQVLNGEVFWAVLRRPASVVGDGVLSVRELVEASNRFRESESSLVGVDLTQERMPKLITLAEETDSWLDRQGLKIDSVPDKGVVVRLRGAANVSLGGSFRPVLREVHADNLALAVRVGELLNLDLYGVDLLIPDFTRSWTEQECAICEVNTRPEISRGAHDYLLKHLIHRQGRVPVFMGIEDAWTELWHDLLLLLKEGGKSLGIASQESALLSKQKIQGRGYFNHVQILLADRELDVLALNAPFLFATSEGWPVDKIDVLILNETQAKQLSVSHVSHWIDRVQEIWLCTGFTITCEWLGGYSDRVRRVEETDLKVKLMEKIEEFDKYSDE